MKGHIYCIGVDREAGFDLGDEPSLEQLQFLVGGYIELVVFKMPSMGKETFEGYVDEDGIRKQLKRNVKATSLTHRGHVICGTAVIWVPDGLRPATRDPLNEHAMNLNTRTRAKI